MWAANTAAGGEVRAAYRPRGGPWGAPESLDGELGTPSSQPRVAVQPNGEFIAVWLANNDGNVLRWARRPAGGGWSGAGTIGSGRLCGIAALLASADGTVTAIVDGDRFGFELHQGAGRRCVRRRGGRAQRQRLRRRERRQRRRGTERVLLRRRNPLRRRPSAAARWALADGG